MARSDELPGFRKKRDILFGEKTTDEQMRETGRKFMEAEQLDDALEFFARCEADDLVREIAAHAREQGNTALYLRARVVLGEPPEEDELRELADEAMEAKRPSMARLAYVKAGDEEKAEELEKQLLGGEEPQEKPEDLGANEPV